MLRIRSLVLAPASARQQTFVYVSIGCVCIALWVLHTTLPLVFPVDDAYITLDNAAVLVGDKSSSFGASGFLGATSPLHLLLTALLALVMPAARALHSVMWLGALVYALGVARLAFVFRASVLQSLVLVGVACVVAEVPHQLMNGLETGWAMAAVVWTLACASEGLPRGRTTAAFCGLLPLLRPELSVVSILILGVQANERWLATSSRGHAIRAIALDCAIAGIVVLPFAVVLWAATGNPIPSTISAKRHFFAEGCLPSAIKRLWLFNNIHAFAGLLNALSAGVALLFVTRIGRVGALSIVLVLYAYYREFPGALGHYEHRYMYPFIPFLLFGLASCVRHTMPMVRYSAWAIAIGTLLLSAPTAPAAWRRHMSYVGFTVDQLDSVAAWSREHIPVSANVLIHDAGYIAYTTDLRLVDLVGLKTPRAADANARLTWPSCGRGRADAIHEIAIAGSAEYLIVLTTWDRIFHIAAALFRHGWHLTRIRRVPDAGYEVYKLDPPVGPTRPSDR